MTLLVTKRIRDGIEKLFSIEKMQVYLKKIHLYLESLGTTRMLIYA